MSIHTVWAMGGFDQVMYRHPIEPWFFTPGKEKTPASLTNHLATKPHGSIYTDSAEIGGRILTHQEDLGLSSDWVTDGLWMSDFDPIITINNLTLPGSGVAWHYFSDEGFIGMTIKSTIPFQGLDLGFNWYSNTTQVIVDFSTPEVDNFLLTDELVISGLVFIGFASNLDGTFIDPDEVTKVGDNYVHKPAYQEFNRLFIRPDNSSREINIKISADAFPVDSPGLLDENYIANHVSIINMQSHIGDSSIHYGIDDLGISDSSTFSANFLYDLGDSRYNDMPPSGDGWMFDGVEYTPDTDNAIMAEYIAIGGPSLGYVEIRHPDTNQVLATSVNGVGGIWAKFSIESDKKPIAPQGVALRKLNSSTGYSNIGNLYSL